MVSRKKEKRIRRYAAWRLDLKASRGFMGFSRLRATLAYQGERCVTSGRGSVIEPQRRANMSRTIMTASVTIKIVVTTPRRREGAASRMVGKLFDMMLAFRLRAARRAAPSWRAMP
jgi:hypothetical protein